jgi:hypothetical protein
MLITISLIIGILLAIALLFLLILQAKAAAELKQIAQSLQGETLPTAVFSPAMIADLPEPVQRYFLHAIAPGTPLATAVELSMTGHIRLAPEQAWLPLQAEEVLSTQGFLWKAVAGQGLMQMHGADYYTNGNGRMRFSLWGLIPVVNAHSPDVRRSAIGRWVGEYFWLPAALLPAQGVHWQAIDPNTIQASLIATGEPMNLTFEIDSQGKLLRGSFLRWGNQTEAGDYAQIPFGGEYQAEQTFAGYTIPVQMEAGWWIGTERYFEFLQVAIAQARFHSKP